MKTLLLLLTLTACGPQLPGEAPDAGAPDAGSLNPTPALKCTPGPFLTKDCEPAR